MPLIAVGLSHRTAPLEVRERLVFASDDLEPALHELVALPGVTEGAILSTCNRTELYLALEGDEVAKEFLGDWLARYHQLSTQSLAPYLYMHEGPNAVKHMFRVAAGLDSLILGEPQILGQMKEAYQNASRAGTLHQLLSKLFQYTFSVAKQIRTDTAIGVSAVSVAFAAVSLARQIFGDLQDQTALLIGAGDTIELTARHLHEQKVGRLIVANRTVQRAHSLASQFDGYAIALSEIPAHLNEADIVISSTASQLPILGKGAVERAVKIRKHRPMFMVDVAVPRDIEPEVDTLDDVYLYTVDDLKGVVEQNLRSRQEAARQAEEIVESQTSHFMGWVRSLDAVNTIRHYRHHAEHLRDEVLDKARQQVAQGKDPEEVLQYLAHVLTNKLIHHPSAQLRQAGYDGRTDLLEAARELLCQKDSE